MTEQIVNNNDSLVIRHYGYGIDGGCMLDASDYTGGDHIYAGHIVIQSDDDARVCKPMPVNGDAYAALPAGYHYLGATVTTVKTEYPFVGVIVAGEVNDALSPFPIDAIKKDVMAATSLTFNHD